VFDKGSRYESVETATVDVTTPAGAKRQVRYVRRRFLPPVDEHSMLLEHRVTAGERLDLLAARYAGDPLQFWRLCDANDVLRPEDLEVEGRIVAISIRAR
jgi:hypothetical protein